jgi:hypothetical protein
MSKGARRGGYKSYAERNPELVAYLNFFGIFFWIARGAWTDDLGFRFGFMEIQKSRAAPNRRLTPGRTEHLTIFRHAYNLPPSDSLRSKGRSIATDDDAAA